MEKNRRLSVILIVTIIVCVSASQSQSQDLTAISRHTRSGVQTWIPLGGRGGTLIVEDIRILGNEVFLLSPVNQFYYEVYVAGTRDTTWTKRSDVDFSFSEPSPYPRMITMDSAGFIYIPGGKGGIDEHISRSKDSARTWTNHILRKWMPMMVLSEVCWIESDGRNNLYAGTIFGQSGVYASSDHGETWERKRYGDAYHLIVAADGAVLVADTLGIYRSGDRGNTWTLYGMADRRIAHISIAEWGQVFAATDNGMLYASSDSGRTWLKRGDDSDSTLVQAVTPVPNGLLFAITSKGICVSNDTGRSWKERNEGLARNCCYRLRLDTGGIMYACTCRGAYRFGTALLKPACAIVPGGRTTICPGDSALLDAGPGWASYLWSNGSRSKTIFAKAPGPYRVTVTDSIGAYATSEPVSVAWFPAPSPAITPKGPITLCPGDSVVLDTGPGWTSHAWTGGATTRSIVVSKSGWFQVKVMDSNGCKGTSPQVIVTQRNAPLPVISADGPTTFCEGGSVQLDAGAGWARYLWSTGDTVRRITVTLGGTYFVRVTDSYGCSGESAPLEVKVRPNPPTPAVTQSVNTLTSTQAARYQWNFNGAPVAGATQRSYNPPRDGRYTVTVWNEDSCSATSAAFDFTATAIEVAATATGVSIYPDPNGGMVRVDIVVTAPGGVKLQLADLLGRTVADFPEESVESRYEREIDMRGLPSGMYFLRIGMGGEMRIRRILKSR
jgi:hypothetical protein